MGTIFAAVRTTFGRRAPAASPHAEPRPTVVSHAELAPCTCPEHCERDHEHD